MLDIFIFFYIYDKSISLNCKLIRRLKDEEKLQIKIYLMIINRYAYFPDSVKYSDNQHF
jgi:hypothetical protein